VKKDKWLSLVKTNTTMSIAEAIQERVTKMSESEQLRLLDYVNYLSFLKGEVSENDVSEYDRLLKELLMKRYQAAKAHPERSTPWKEVQQQIKQKYGW
jgi:tyrosine-protein phosphatase YwqE